MNRSISPDDKTVGRVLGSMNRNQNTGAEDGESQLFAFPEMTTSGSPMVVRRDIKAFSEGIVLMSDLDIIKSLDTPFKDKLIEYHHLDDNIKKRLIITKNIKYQNHISKLKMTPDIFFKEIGLITPEQQKNFILGSYDDESKYENKNTKFESYMRHLKPYNDIQNQDLKKLIFDFYFTIIIISKLDLIQHYQRQIIIDFFLLPESQKPMKSIGYERYSSLFCGELSLLNKIKDISLKKAIKMFLYRKDDSSLYDYIKPVLTTDTIAKLTINTIDITDDISNIIFNYILYNFGFAPTFINKESYFYGILRNTKTKDDGIKILTQKNLHPVVTQEEIKEFTDIGLIHGGKKIKLPRKQNIFIKQKKSLKKRVMRRNKKQSRKRSIKKIKRKRSRKRY